MILAIVLMILSAICFALKFFGVDIDGHDLVALGLTLLAAAFVAAWYWGPRRPLR